MSKSPDNTDSFDDNSSTIGIEYDSNLSHHQDIDNVQNDNEIAKGIEMKQAD